MSLFFGMPACKKAKGPANGNSVQPNNNLDSTVGMTATINGRDWKSDSAYGYFVLKSGNDSSNVNLMITATQKLNDTARTITFNINNYTGPNSYTINPPFNTATYYVGNFRHFSDSGIVIVASDTAYGLRGTFYFKADTFTIAAGRFDVAIP